MPREILSAFVVSIIIFLTVLFLLYVEVFLFGVLAVAASCASQLCKRKQELARICGSIDWILGVYGDRILHGHNSKF